MLQGYYFVIGFCNDVDKAIQEHICRIMLQCYWIFIAMVMLVKMYKGPKRSN